MELLILLVERRDSLVARQEITDRIWGSKENGDTERSINTAIRKIRQALEDDTARPRFVETVVGKGYRFIAEVVEIRPAAAEPRTAPDNAIQEDVRSKRGAQIMWAVAAVITGLAALGIVTAHRSRGAEPMRVSPFTALPGSETGPTFSPDGNQVAFSWSSEDGSRQQLYVKVIGSQSLFRLTATADLDSDPSWSSDGRWIAFLRQSAGQQAALFVMSSSGGAARRLYQLSSPIHFQPSWSPDANWLAILDSDSHDAPPSIFLLGVQSGEKRRLTRAVPTTDGDWGPAISPDGRMVAFLRNSGRLGSSLIFSLRIDRNGLPLGQPTQIQTDRVDCNGLQWSPDGLSLICAANGSLRKIPAKGGPAEPLPFKDAAQVCLSRRGNRMVYVESIHDTDIFRLPGVGQVGTPRTLISSTRMDGAPQYARDGQRIAFVSARSGSEQIWVSDSEGQNPVQRTSIAGGAGCPRWSPDGHQIAFDSSQLGRSDIYVVDSEGGLPRPITSAAGNNVRPSWSHDGKSIYFGSDRSGDWEIWKASAENGAAIRVTFKGGREGFEDPQGAFVYYTKSRGARGIWRMPATGGAEKLVSDEGIQGRWAIGQRGLYYLTAEGTLELHDAAGHRVAIPTPGMRPVFGSGGGSLAIAPADRWILITGLVRSDADLTIVDNFHL